MADDKIKQSFKYYKSKDPPPTFQNIIDIYDTNAHDVIPFNLVDPREAPLAGLKAIRLWRAFQHSRYPGFVLIRNPFKDGYQRYWAFRCLRDYPVKPSRTNLDNHVDLKEDDNIWEISTREQLKQPNSKTLLQRLRWTTLGYHHNWDTKVYGEDDKTPFPDDLAVLSKYISASLGWNSYNAEAAIINYYNLSSTLGGHTDHSEFDHEAPLISVSFGQTAIFLVGGVTREEEPIAVYLRSGDIAVMMGPSRLAYHAIPRIISRDQEQVRQCFLSEPTDAKAIGDKEICDRVDSTVKLQDNITDVEKCAKAVKMCSDERLHWQGETVCKEESNEITGACVEQITDFGFSEIEEINGHITSTTKYLTDEVWEPYSEYLNCNRINMNIRQVLKPGEGFPGQAHQDEQCKRQKVS